MTDEFSVRFQPMGGNVLRAHMTGVKRLDTVVACWREVEREVGRRGTRAVLAVDELRGPPLPAEDWKAMIDALVGGGLERIPIAHVKPDGVDLVEHCEIFANEVGANVRIFDNEHLAEIWLRYVEPGAPVDEDRWPAPPPP